MPNQIAFYPQTSGGSSTMSLIQSITATSEASVTFSAIPQTFKNLKLVCNYSLASGTNLVMTLNSVTTSTYSFGLMFADANTAVASSGSSQPYIEIAGFQGLVVLDIPNYAATPSFGVQSIGTFSQTGGALFTGTCSGSNAGITSVTSITLSEISGTALFVAGSLFELYGY